MRHAPGALVNRYARALFNIALEQNALAAVRTEVQQITDAWRDNPEFPLIVTNPRLTKERVRALLSALADQIQAGELTRHFLNLLVDKDRLDVLYDLGSHFEKLWRVHVGEVLVTVTTAVPVADSLKSTIERHLHDRSKMKPLVTYKQDPALLGGIVVEWPDRVFDGSLVRKLEHLKAHLAENV